MPGEGYRETKQRCKCGGQLLWNRRDKRYTCSQCGIQVEALKQWVKTGERRETVKEMKKRKHAEYVNRILGKKTPKPKKITKEDRLKEEWGDLIQQSENDQQE